MSPLDDELRRRLSAAARNVTVPPVALGELRPRLHRARRTRRVIVGGTAVLLLGSGTAAAVQLSQQLGGRHVRTLSTAERPPEPDTPLPTSSIAPTSSVEPASTVDTDAVAVTEPSVEPTTSPVVSDPATSAPSAPVVEPTTSAGGAPVPTGATTAPTTVPSPPPPATTTPPASTAPSGPLPTRVVSACGVVVVTVDGDDTRLVGTEPQAGLSVDVKNDGPEEVEVGFAGGGRECEVKAWVAQGTLRTFVDNHGEPSP